MSERKATRAEMALAEVARSYTGINAMAADLEDLEEQARKARDLFTKAKQAHNEKVAAVAELLHIK